MKKVSIIGAGNGGVTAAYHISKLGYNVCIYDSPEFDKQINAINVQGGIKALDKDHGCKMLFSGFQEITKATTNIEEAVNFSDVLIMICPSFAQEILFKKMLPYFKDNQILMILPGNYAGLVLNKIKNKIRPELNLTFVDGISIPWACRISSPAVTTIMGIKEFLPVSIYPKYNLEFIKNKIDNILPIRLEYLENPIQAGLENINFGGHPLLTTLNMGILENFDGNFVYYKDCCSKATSRAAAKMDKERLSVGKAYDIKLRSELDAMNSLYNTNYDTVYKFNRASVSHSKIDKAPTTSNHRYITEDVPYLMVPCFELGKKAGLDLPIVTSCINIANAYNNKNYFKTGRTLEKMGLKDMSLEEIKEFLKK